MDNVDRLCPDTKASVGAWVQCTLGVWFIPGGNNVFGNVDMYLFDNSCNMIGNANASQVNDEIKPDDNS